MLRRMILVAIGSNLPTTDGTPPPAICAQAVRRLVALPELECLAVSSAYRSPAFPPSAQPDYVNAAVLLRGNVEPHDFLNTLHRLEASFMRVRGDLNAARTLDLDLLGIDDLVVDSPALSLPHPRLHLRRFVLMPLGDVAPSWIHPKFGRNVAEMLAALPDDGSCRRDPAATEILAIPPSSA